MTSNDALLPRLTRSEVLGRAARESSAKPWDLEKSYSQKHMTLQRWYQDQAGSPSTPERGPTSRPKSVDSSSRKQNVESGRARCRAPKGVERGRGGDERSSARYQRDLPAPTGRLTGADRLFGSATVPRPALRRKPDADPSHSRDMGNADSSDKLPETGFKTKSDVPLSYRPRDTQSGLETGSHGVSGRESRPRYRSRGNENKEPSAPPPRSENRRRPDDRSRFDFNSRYPANEDFIPFESNKNELDSIASGPTLTESERKVFEQLRNLDYKKKRPAENHIEEAEAPPVQRPERKTAASSLDAILDAALAEPPTDLTDEAGRHERRKTTDQVLERPPVNPHVLAELQRAAKVRMLERTRITTLINECRTDHAVWKVLEDSILGPIARLDLDASEQSKSARGISRRSRRQETASSESVESRLETIGPNLAHLLAYTASTLRQKFPSSPLLAALIPRLRQTGPSAFALGATTRLYNESLAQIVDQNGDFLAVADLMVEMEREVIPLDHWTARLLGQLLEESMNMRSGARGEAAKSFVNTDRVKKAQREILKPLREWRRTGYKEAKRAKYEQESTSESAEGEGLTS